MSIARPRKDTSLIGEASPCSPCKHATRCGKALLACDEFLHYLGTPGSSGWKGPTVGDSQRFPTRALYDRLHAHHPTKAEKAWRAAGKARTANRGGSW